MYLAATRYFLIGVLLVLNIAILVLASSLLTIANNDNIYHPINVYLIFLSAFSCVFLIPIALIDFFRRGALPSRVLYELIWLVLFWVMHLAGASALTAAPKCTANDSCESVQHTLLVFAWLAVSVLLIHLTALLVITLLHANDLPGIWSTGVRDVPWFHPSQQGKSAPAGVPNLGATPQQNGGQPQQSQSQPWHGRRRSHASHSWRERYSQSFTPQATRDQENQGPVSNDDVDAARAFYPFLGQGAGVGVIPEHEDETMLEPLPVSFTLERIQPPATQTPLSRPRGNSGSRNGGSNPFYNQAMQDARTRDSLVRSEEQHARQSNSRQLPQAPEPSVSPQRSRSRVQTAYSAGPSGSQSRDRPSREPQLVPLELSQTPSKPQLQSQASSSSQVPRQTLQRQPPSDSLLFSGAQHSTNDTSAAAPSSFQRPQRAAAPPSSTRILPDTSAFYGTHIQSVLRGRETETEGGPDTGDGRSMTPSTRVYASTPKPKPLSAAQAYAAEAQRRPSNDRSGSSRR